MTFHELIKSKLADNPTKSLIIDLLGILLNSNKLQDFKLPNVRITGGNCQEKIICDYLNIPRITMCGTDIIKKYGLAKRWSPERNMLQIHNRYRDEYTLFRIVSESPLTDVEIYNLLRKKYKLRPVDEIKLEAL